MIYASYLRVVKPVRKVHIAQGTSKCSIISHSYRKATLSALLPTLPLIPRPDYFGTRIRAEDVEVKRLAHSSLPWTIVYKHNPLWG